MGKPHPAFRENPKRAVYITGEINQVMVDRLTPTILNLRGESTDPITVYIDSAGGSTFHARLLMYLLTSPNQDGIRCAIVTVVTGVAASAAADILASGDYAIAYYHAIIHYHGVRTSRGEITHESASTLAEVLKQSNEGFALELANRVKRRFFFIYTQLKNGFPEVRTSDPEASIVECLARCMSAHLSRNSELLELALAKHKRLNSLLTEYNKRLAEHQQPFARAADKEAFLIRFLVDWELKENKETSWRFGTDGLTAIREDFVLLGDYEDGQHMRNLDQEIRDWGGFILEGLKRDKFLKLSGDKAATFVRTEARETFRAVWHFLVSVCRALQQGENQLTSHEAYWLGLIDEIPGSSLYTFREMIENFEEEGTKTKGKVRSIAASTKRKLRRNKGAPSSNMGAGVK